MWETERTIRGVDASRDELLPYAGPAALLPLFGALARLPYRIAVGVWTALLIAAFVALALAALALAGVASRAAAVAALALALASGPGTSDVALGQIAVVAAAGLALAVVAFRHAARSGEPRGRAGATLGGAAATLLAAAQPNLALPLIARLRDRWAIAGGALAASAFVALTLAAGGGIGGARAYLGLLGAHAAAERFDAIQHTPAAIAYAFGAAPAAAFAAGALCAVAAVAATVVAIVKLRLGPRDGTLAAIAALPLAAPFFHEHDFVIVLLPLIVLAASACGTARAWAGAAAALVLVDWFGLAQHPGAAAQILACGAACVALFAALRTRPLGRADIAPFAVLALAACFAVPLARSAPAPVWPDALPAGYRAPAAASASEVWRDEQHAARLDRAVPAWAILRALPLAGCICVFIAITLDSRRRTPST